MCPALNNATALPEKPGSARGSQPPLTPAPRDLTPSAGLQGHLNTCGRYTCAQREKERERENKTNFFKARKQQKETEKCQEDNIQTHRWSRVLTKQHFHAHVCNVWGRYLVKTLSRVLLACAGEGHGAAKNPTVHGMTPRQRMSRTRAVPTLRNRDLEMQCELEPWLEASRVYLNSLAWSKHSAVTVNTTQLPQCHTAV